jgi:hypothetical protein
LQFDPEQLSFERLEPLSADISSENFGLNRSRQGLISFAYSLETQNNSSPYWMFKVVFRTKKDQDLTEMLRLSNWPTPALAYSSEGAAWKPILRESNPAAVSIIAPNPFGQGGTWVKAQKNETLEIWDARGKSLFSKYMTVGSEIHLESALFPRAGVYFWKMGELSGRVIFTP